MKGSIDYERDVLEDLFEQSLGINVLLTWYPFARMDSSYLLKTSLPEVGILKIAVG